MQQYEIWWAKLPQPAGRRPVLLLTRTSAYRYLNRVLAVEITSTIRSLATEVPLGKAEGLSTQSVATFDNVVNMPVAWLDERIGVLSSQRHQEVKRAFGHALQWDELI